MQGCRVRCGLGVCHLQYTRPQGPVVLLLCTESFYSLVLTATVFAFVFQYSFGIFSCFVPYRMCHSKKTFHPVLYGSSWWHVPCVSREHIQYVLSYLDGVKCNVSLDVSLHKLVLLTNNACRMLVIQARRTGRLKFTTWFVVIGNTQLEAWQQKRPSCWSARRFSLPHHGFITDSIRIYQGINF